MANLDEILWMWAYKPGSKSARVLADVLDIWQIAHNNSNFQGQRGQFIINWGGGTGNFDVHVGVAKVLNPPAAIDRSINKISFFYDMKSRLGPRCPIWTESAQLAMDWLDDEIPVIARTQVEGHDGAGLVLMKKPLDFIHAPLYTIKVDSVAEYRLYMFGNDIIDARIKTYKLGKGDEPKDKIRIGDDWVYNLVKVANLPPDVVIQAAKAMPRTGLLYGGLDVIVDKDGLAYILEMNTSPYLGDMTAEKYAVKFREYVEAA